MRRRNLPTLVMRGSLSYLILALVLFELFGREHIREFVRILFHRAELGYPYRLAVFAHSLVEIEYLAAVAQLDDEREDKVKPRKGNEKDERRHYVERPLCECVKSARKRALFLGRVKSRGCGTCVPLYSADHSSARSRAQCHVLITVRCSVIRHHRRRYFVTHVFRFVSRYCHFLLRYNALIAVHLHGALIPHLFPVARMPPCFLLTLHNIT